MNQQHYLDIILSIIPKAEIKGSNIIAYSDVEEKQQLGWELLCAVYDKEFTKHINQIIVK